MKNKKTLLVMLVMILAFGFTVISCIDTPDDPPKDPPPVNVFDGTWVGTNEDNEVETLVLNDNSFQISIDDVNYCKGTFALTPINNITLTVTHLSGEILTSMAEDVPDSDGEVLAFENDWYTKDEIITAFTDYYESVINDETFEEFLEALEIDDIDSAEELIAFLLEQVEAVFEEIFTPQSGTVTPGVNTEGKLTLTIEYADGETTVYTKQDE